MAAIENLRRLLGRLFTKQPSCLFRTVSGVIHVGANAGQERNYYGSLGLRVLWVEPIPWVFKDLETNIAGFPKQEAVQALVTDKDGEAYEFHVASNNGASSSIFDFKHHRDIWPGVHFKESISLKSTTLTSLLRERNIDPGLYQALVLDTQGSELLVLEGARSLLRHFRFVKTEAADFESYAGCCRLEEIDRLMESEGFRQTRCYPFAHRPDGGAYYDVTYERSGRVVPE